MILLRISCVVPGGLVGGEHGGVPEGSGTLHGKIIAELKGSLHKKKSEIVWSFAKLGVPPPL